MKQLNIHRLNMNSLNCVHLNVVGAASSGGAVGGYVKDGLVMQFDFSRGISMQGGTCVWKSANGNGIAVGVGDPTSYVVTTDQYFRVTEGDLPNSFNIEICLKSDGSDELTYKYSKSRTDLQSIGINFSGQILSVRVYDATKYSDEVKEKNASIDQRRFVAPPVPENALVDIDDCYILDAEENFIVDNN